MGEEGEGELEAGVKKKEEEVAQVQSAHLSFLWVGGGWWWWWVEEGVDGWVGGRRN